eukprot:CAMPEP_0201540272 /NCGR_PEP_ID=MMETSP0161_2-20130828/70851_1 /ASSEMBLY_ACC=CAM_ASM_000251 /TAXON_ID=180227 /ORGANISM="Neoparamoeba aestuarina, Strain SoJaBio B1-5/56/2" /LENGTH=397 /DNA_ID=CAMNT_0047947727 /DNA_START=565 /DNA_END=1758 /DNA_ORIENTATION=-
MAERLANIFGTEKDKVNCPFYFKIGACRHGDRCSRLHNRPVISETILFKNMYMSPGIMPAGPDGKPLPCPLTQEQIQEHFEDFYEDIHSELAKYGELAELNVCDNLGEHLVGNVYCRYYDEDAAEQAAKALQGRFYGGRPLLVEYSPVTDFREARCRQFDMGECGRGGFCNFMHLRKISKELSRDLFPRRKDERRGGRDDRRDDRDDRRGGYKDRDRDDRRGGYRDRDRGRDRDRDYDRRDRDRDYDRRDRDRGRDRDRDYDRRDRDRDRDSSDRRDRDRDRDSDRRDRDRDSKDRGGREAEYERRAAAEYDAKEGGAAPPPPPPAEGEGEKAGEGEGAAASFAPAEIPDHPPPPDGAEGERYGERKRERSPAGETEGERDGKRAKVDEEEKFNDVD